MCLKSGSGRLGDLYSPGLSRIGLRFLTRFEVLDGVDEAHSWDLDSVFTRQYLIKRGCD